MSRQPRGKRTTTPDGHIEVVSKNSNGDGSVYFEPRRKMARPGPDIDAMADAAHALGGPLELAHAIRLRAMHRVAADEDLEGAVADAREAVRLNESIAATTDWSQAALAFLLITSGHPDARSEFRRGIASTYATRQWMVIDTLLESVPLVLAATDPPSAAVVFGYVERRPAPGAEIGENLRRMAGDAVEAIPDAAALRARGAAMDRHEIVAFALDALAEP